MAPEILSRKAWYVLPWRYETSTYTTVVTQTSQMSKGYFIYFSKDPHSRSISIWHAYKLKWSNVNLIYFWWVECIGTEKNASFKSVDALHTLLGLIMLRALLMDSNFKCL